MTTVLLVRHGQTEWNREERFRGRADIPLNDVGLNQAALTGRRIRAESPPAAVYTSPLSRAVQTGEAISAPVQALPGLIDVDYGLWQGLTFDEVETRYCGMMNQFFANPYALLIPGGESFDQAETRALASLADICKRHPSGTVVVVGHAVLNRILIVGAMGFPKETFWRLGQDNCAISILQIEGGIASLSVLNDTCHLREASHTG